MRLFATLLVALLVSGCGGGGDNNNNEPENTSENTPGVITLSGADTSIVGVKLDVGDVGFSFAAASQPDYIVIVDENSTVEFTPPNELTPYIADINNGFVLAVIDDTQGVGKAISMAITVNGVKHDYICHTNAPTWSTECGDANSIILDLENGTVSFNSATVINTDTATILTIDGTLIWSDSAGGNNNSGGGGIVGNGVTTELEGKWTYTCEYNDDYGPAFDFYETGSIIFSENIYTASWIEYSDSACTVVDYVGSNAGTFSIGNSITTSSGLSAKEIDFNIYYSIFRIEGDRLYFGDLGNYDEIEDDWEYSGSTDENRPIDLDFSFFYRKE